MRDMVLGTLAHWILTTQSPFYCERKRVVHHAFVSVDFTVLIQFLQQSFPDLFPSTASVLTPHQHHQVAGKVNTSEGLSNVGRSEESKEYTHRRAATLG